MGYPFGRERQLHTAGEFSDLASSFCVSPVRHFDDVDNLLKFGRDGEVLPGQEDKARKLAEYLLEHTEKEGRSKILLVSSTKKRGQQTAEMIATEIHELNSEIEVEIRYTGGLNSLRQGTPILPDGYQPGDVFEGYPLAEKIFNQETYGEPPNDQYRFGDPVLQEDGSYKYPELVKHFEKPGESNRDFMIRLYTFLLNMAGYIKQYGEDVEVLLVTHAQVYQILKNMRIVSKKIDEGRLTLEPGELPHACWAVYQEGRKEGVEPSYDPRDISTDVLTNQQMVNLLQRELAYLKNLK